MADLQEIIKTHTKSYPSYLDTYPRNGKTTVIVETNYRNFMNYGMEDFFEELIYDLVSYSSGPFPGAYAASKGSTGHLQDDFS